MAYVCVNEGRYEYVQFSQGGLKAQKQKVKELYPWARYIIRSKLGGWIACSDKDALNRAKFQESKIIITL